MAELLDRARQLVAAGPYDARPAEIVAVHAAVYPQRDPVCPTCPRELGPAFFAIKRWVEQQGAASDPGPNSTTTMEKTAITARLKPGIIYTPHGLGIAYTNTNLTEKAALDILAADPDAEKFFEVLPAGYEPAKPEGTEGEDDEQDDDKPVALSRANKAQLEAFYQAEVAPELPEAYTNDDLRKAIAEKRAAAQA